MLLPVICNSFTEPWSKNSLLLYQAMSRYIATFAEDWAFLDQTVPSSTAIHMQLPAVAICGGDFFSHIFFPSPPTGQRTQRGRCCYRSTLLPYSHGHFPEARDKCLKETESSYRQKVDARSFIWCQWRREGNITFVSPRSVQESRNRYFCLTAALQ